MILDFRNGVPVLLVEDRDTEGLLLVTMLGDALGSTLWSPARLSLCSVLLTVSADFTSVKEKNFLAFTMSLVLPLLLVARLS